MQTLFRTTQDSRDHLYYLEYTLQYHYLWSRTIQLSIVGHSTNIAAMLVLQNGI